jgi:hypothetical protein
MHSIHAYDAKEARIVVQEKFPTTTHGHATAIVTIENILENVNHELLQVGSWVNIVGYVRDESNVKKRFEKSPNGFDKSKVTGCSANVDATMIWSGGAIKLDQYRRATREYQNLHSAK